MSIAINHLDLAWFEEKKDFDTFQSYSSPCFLLDRTTHFDYA